MAFAQTKTTVRTRTMLRNGLVYDTTRRFLDIPRKWGRDMSFWDERLELMIRNQAIVALDVCLMNEAGPVGGVYLNLDWKEHGNQCVSFGEEVDMSAVPEGETFGSIQEVLDAAGLYFGALCAKSGASKFVIWYTLNPVEVEKYGLPRLYEILDIHHSEDHTRKMEKELKRYEAARSGGRERGSRMADLREGIAGGWIAGGNS